MVEVTFTVLVGQSGRCLTCSRVELRVTLTPPFAIATVLYQSWYSVTLLTLVRSAALLYSASLHIHCRNLLVCQCLVELTQRINKNMIWI